MFGTAPLLEITNLEFQVTAKWIHLSWTDGRDNSQTRSIQTNDMVYHIMEKYNYNKNEARYFVHHHLTRPMVRAYMEKAEMI